MKDFPDFLNLSLVYHTLILVVGSTQIPAISGAITGAIESSGLVRRNK